MRFDLYGPDERRFLRLMEELGGDYARSTPALTVRWLLDQHYHADRPHDGDPRVDQIIQLWEDIVVPYTQYATPVPSDTLKADISSCLEVLPSIGDWEQLFAKVVALRGLCASGSFSLPRIVAKRDKGRLIFNIADGNYDKWTNPNHSGATLEQILDGRDPGDWLSCPKSENPVIWTAMDRVAPQYCSLLCRAEPHTARWLLAHGMNTKNISSMRGLLDPLVQHQDINYWRTYGLPESVHRAEKEKPRALPKSNRDSQQGGQGA